MKGIHVFLADGFEDIEALSVTDVLRRGGLDVRNVSISDDLSVTSAHGVKVEADVLLKDIQLSSDGTCPSDYMIFPGGMPGASNLAGCDSLMTAMQEHIAAGGSLAAICAAPGLVLSKLDNLRGVMFTCYEGFQNPLRDRGWIYTAEPSNIFSLQAGNYIVTGRGPGYALEFAFDLLATVSGEDVSDKIREQMYLL